MTSVPTLAEVALHPELLDGLPAPVCGALIVQMAALQQRAAVRIAAVPVILSEEPDELLDVAEAARRLGIARGTLAKRPIYAQLRVDIGVRRARYSARLIREFLAGSVGARPVEGAPRGNEQSRAAQPLRSPAPRYAWERPGGSQRGGRGDGI